MINKDKWINSLPNINNRSSQTESQLDYDKWINTIPKKNAYNSVKKYSLIAFLFIFGFLLVSAVKNETRNLQKIINNLEASVDVIRFNLDQAILDNEVITSPKNISLLAEDYLDIDLVSYKRSQIKGLNDKSEKSVNANNEEKIRKKKIDIFQASIKEKVAKQIKERKTEIRKLQELYSDPKSLPGEVKIQVAKQIEEKRVELKNIYQNPGETITLARVQRWGAVQIVKAFLGMPIIPGR